MVLLLDGQSEYAGHEKDNKISSKHSFTSTKRPFSRLAFKRAQHILNNHMMKNDI